LFQNIALKFFQFSFCQIVADHIFDKAFNNSGFNALIHVKIAQVSAQIE
jgi:hypothetical protein